MKPLSRYTVTWYWSDGRREMGTFYSIEDAVSFADRLKAKGVDVIVTQQEYTCSLI